MLVKAPTAQTTKPVAKVLSAPAAEVDAAAVVDWGFRRADELDLACLAVFSPDLACLAVISPDLTLAA